MENFFGGLLIILLAIVLVWPLLQKWLAPLFQKWLVGKMEDGMRRMAGMPTRKEEKKARRKSRGNEREWAETFGRRRNTPADYMRAYAEDVEFEEIKEKEERK